MSEPRDEARRPRDAGQGEGGASPGERTEARTAYEELRKRVSELPTGPGVYIFKDEEGRVLYVGKASNLRNRVRSYFLRKGDQRYFVRLLETQLADVDVVLTNNEKEALLLECTLIKKHRPKYNVQLRDDKNYVLVRVDRRSTYPRLEIVRRMKPDGASYLGPFPSAHAARAAVRFASRHFGLRICSDREMARRTRACVHCQMSPYPAPCVDEVDPADYEERLSDALALLSGRHGELVRKFEESMQRAAENLEFEQAARYRDLVAAIRKLAQVQDVVLPRPVDWDVVGFARNRSRVEVCVLEVRSGAVTARRMVSLSRQKASDQEVLGSFLALYYTSGRMPPRQVLVPFAVEGVEALQEVLAERRGGKVSVSVGRRGVRRRLVELANRNAAAGLERRSAAGDVSELLGRLAGKLRLKRVPERIECFDVSTLQGQGTVASMAVFQDGRPDKRSYRLFRIQQARAPDDYAAMREALTRRFRRAKKELAGWELPDLLVLDGGMGQLKVAETVVRDLGLVGKLDLVAIAKGPPPGWEERRAAAVRAGLLTPEEAEGPGVSDHVYLPGVKDPIPVRGREMMLLAAIRDEAHRFALRGNRRIRSREGLASLLEQVPGIGPKRRVALLKEFGSLEALAEASDEQLRACGLPGAVVPKLRKVLEDILGPAGGEAGAKRDPADDSKVGPSAEGG